MLGLLFLVPVALGWVALEAAGVFDSGSGGYDSVDGGNGSDSLFGKFGNDTLVGGLGKDTLGGGSGDDLLIAGQNGSFASLKVEDGGDILLVGEGDDTLVGGGLDILNGGSGKDTYQILDDESTSSAKIKDYEAGSDTIEILYDPNALASDKNSPALSVVLGEDDDSGARDVHIFFDGNLVAIVQGAEKDIDDIRNNITLKPQT